MKRSMKLQACIVVILASLSVTGSCDNREPAGPVMSIEMLRHAGNMQIAPAGAALPLPLVVIIRDQNGVPAPGITVTWNSTGTLSSSTSTTDAAGLANVQVTLAAYAGGQLTRATVQAYGVFADFVSFAQIQGATQMEYQPGDHGNFQTDTVDATLSAPFKVLVRDHTGRPVAGVVVFWTLPGLGIAPDGTTTTNASGVATFLHRAGPTPGIDRVEAQVQGLHGSPVVFSTTVMAGRPVELVKIAGDNQWGKIGREISPYLVAALDRRQHPVRNVSVNWVITSGTGRLAAAQSTTSNAGAASAVHTLGPSPGAQTVTASLAGNLAVAPVMFTANAAEEVVQVISDYYYGEYGYFVPANVAVPVGTRVVWAWCQGCLNANKHTVTFEDNPNPPVSSPTMTTGVHARTFTAPGTYRYRCLFHSTSFSDGMVGQVTVH